MEYIKKLSQKEKNLLFILLIMVILLVSYRFGFVNLSNKTDALYSKNIQLNTKLADLKQKAENKDNYIEETNQMTEEITRMLSNLSTSISQEKSTVFVTELEQNAKMNVSSITYGEVSEVYTSGQSTTSEEGSSDPDVAATDNVITKETTKGSTPAESTGEQVKNQPELKGYKSNITINYQTNYAGLKSAIDYINQNKEKMRIQSLTAAFDNTTGNLTGTLSFDIFALLGEGREEESVNIDGVNIGSDNIFGTFELPVE